MLIKRLVATLSLATFLFGGICSADDFDDKISKPSTDDLISRDDEIGQSDHNIKFLKMKAKSKVKSSDNGGQVSIGSANMNSVVLGTGSEVRGDIIIIDESRGSKSQVVDR